MKYICPIYKITGRYRHGNLIIIYKHVGEDGPISYKNPARKDEWYFLPGSSLNIIKNSIESRVIRGWSRDLLQDMYPIDENDIKF